VAAVGGAPGRRSEAAWPQMVLKAHKQDECGQFGKKLYLKIFAAIPLLAAHSPGYENTSVS
jgi:hypothetical protein